MIFASSCSPIKSFAITLPELSSKNVHGICSTSYSSAIGSFQPFKFEMCVQVNLSFAIASFQRLMSSSKETPIMFNPLEWYLLYKATTLGFSALHGPHHEAQKSIIVTFPNDSFNETTFPVGVFAEKSGAILPTIELELELVLVAELDFFLLSQLLPIDL